MALNHELQNVARLVQERCLQDFWAFQPLTCMTSLASCPTPSFSLSSGSSIKSEPKSGNSIESSLKFGADPSILTNLPLYWLWTLSRWHHHLESKRLLLIWWDTSRNQWNEKWMSQGHMRHHESWHVMTQASWIWSHATDLRKRVESQKIPVVSCWHQSLGTNVASENLNWTQSEQATAFSV